MLIVEYLVVDVSDESEEVVPRMVVNGALDINLFVQILWVAKSVTKRKCRRRKKKLLWFSTTRSKQ